MRQRIIPGIFAVLTLIALFPVRTVPGCPGNLDGPTLLILCPERARTLLGVTYPMDVHPFGAAVIAFLMAGGLAVSIWSFARIRAQERADD